LRKLAFSNSCLQLLQHLCVQRCGASNAHLNLTTVGAHEETELLSDTLKHAEPVVLGEGLHEVAEGLVVAVCALEELLDDGRLVLVAECRGGQDGGELGVGLESLVEGFEGLSDGLEVVGLGGCGVLRNEVAKLAIESYVGVAKCPASPSRILGCKSFLGMSLTSALA
jgi:hypothetical protein